MEAQPHPDATRVLRAPTGMEERVYPLQVQRVDDAFVSRWRPSADEVAILATGGEVKLWVIGDAHPPVALQARGVVAQVDGNGEDKPRSDLSYWLYEFQKLMTNVRGWVVTGRSETAEREIAALWARWAGAKP